MFHFLLTLNYARNEPISYCYLIFYDIGRYLTLGVSIVLYFLENLNETILSAELLDGQHDLIVDRQLEILAEHLIILIYGSQQLKLTEIKMNFIQNKISILIYFLLVFPIVLTKFSQTLVQRTEQAVDNIFRLQRTVVSFQQLSHLILGISQQVYEGLIPIQESKNILSRIMDFFFIFLTPYTFSIR